MDGVERAATARRGNGREPWVVATVLGLAALLAVVPFGPVSWVYDNRFNLYWSPASALPGFSSLWTAATDLGGTLPKYDPVLFVISAGLDGLGAPPWLIQRMLHFGLLLTGGAGAAALMRRFQPDGFPITGRLAAGLLYMLSPVTASFLFPSDLYLNYAIAPWLLLAYIEGVTTTARWRWSAVFALLVLTSSWNNLPGLIWAMVPLLAATWYLIVVEQRTTWPRVAHWLTSAGGLVALILLPGLMRVTFGSDALAAQLYSTESVEAVTMTSSWAETWRGLGFWLSYFSVGGAVLGHTTERYFTSAAWVLATFAVPVAALAVVWRASWRPRLLFAAMVVIAGTVMVGAHPFDSPSPFGRVLIELYDRVDFAFGMRTTYKAAAGLMLGLSVLVGFGIGRFGPRARSRGARVLGGAGLVAGFGLLAWPFWSGSLYERPLEVDAIASHWESAADWVDAQPGDTRVMILPGAPQELYRWGSPLDGFAETIFDRTTLQRRSLSVSPPIAANLIEGVDAAASSVSYRAGTIGPIARRLGVEYVLVRNDLRWERMGVVRPADLDPVRDDPDLELVTSFGSDAEDVVADDAAGSIVGTEEAELAAIEIYRVAGVEDPATVRPVTPSLLVAGDGYAWGWLARSGHLDTTAPVRYTGVLDETALRRELEQGATVVVTDTNRRRMAPYAGQDSETLPASFDDPLIVDLFGRPGSQSVAGYGDAETITEGRGGTLATVPRANRPAAAFDGLAHTSWLTGNQVGIIGQRLHVELHEPTRVHRLRLRPSRTVRRPSQVTVTFSNGSSVPVRLAADGVTEVAIDPRTVDGFTLRIDEVTGEGFGAFGMAEVDVGDIDLRESIVVPDDVNRAAEDSPTLRDLLQSAPTIFHFERLRGPGPDEEPVLRRRFDVIGPRAFAVQGELGAGRVPEGNGCRDVGLTIDGHPVPVRPVASGPGPRRFEGCDPVRLDDGVHQLDDGGHGIVAELVLGTQGSDPSPVTGAAPFALEVIDRSDTSLQVRIHGDGEALLTSGVAHTDQWRASLDGDDLGDPVASDAQSSWTVPVDGTAEVQIELAPQSAFRYSVLLSIVAVLGCVVLVVWNPQAPSRAAPRARHRRRWIGDTGLVAGGVLIGGLVGGIVTVGAVAVARRGPSPGRYFALAATALMLFAALFSLPPLGPALTPLDFGWPSDRGLAHSFGRVAASLMLAAVVLLGREESASEQDDAVPGQELAEPGDP